MPNPPTAAQAIYGHLPSAAREPVKQSRPTIGNALWPSLTPKPPPNWRGEDIALIKYSIQQGRSDAEVARRYGVSKQAVAEIRKLRR